ncbi:glycosyltransferase family 2 protein [Chryseobacterium sp. FH1]|uniref:glycosyltransferase family 2 protein n=1 Tax=Chryseobacterium sp. FH1 TaxID=1233951 RepID=UPI000691E2E0|nr:glycosyltransferase family 2 protein [Chryseobacterium sp. FH1]
MLLSIIIPCHNSVTTIDRAVNSVFSQTWKNWELILVNNNSTDDTWERLLDIQKSNSTKNIIVLDEKKKGAPAARNKGLYEAGGEWIQFLDADDELLPEKLQTQIAHIDDSMDAVYSPYHSVKIDSVNSHYIIKNDIWEALMMSKIGITSSNLFRKEALVSVNGWDENLSSSQDSALAFALLKNNSRFSPLDKILTNIYATEFSITRTQDKNKVKSIINNYIGLRKDILLYLETEEYNLNKYKKIYQRVFADCYLWYFENAALYTWTEYNSKTKDHFINRLKTNYSFLRKLINNPKIIKNIF